jgi:hypothetical protein
MAAFKVALEIHDALAEAFLERTGKVLERDSDYSVADVKRASRILRSEGRIQKGSTTNRRLVAEILRLNPKA